MTRFALALLAAAACGTSHDPPSDAARVSLHDAVAATGDATTAGDASAIAGDAGSAAPDAMTGTCTIAYPQHVGCHDPMLNSGSAFCVPDRFVAGQMDPYHGCWVCDPSASATAWTPAADGTPCGTTGGSCQQGVCSTAHATGACSDGWDCQDNTCLAEVGEPTQCAQAGQPGDACYAGPGLGGCANGLVCIPTDCATTVYGYCYAGYDPCL